MTPETAPHANNLCYYNYLTAKLFVPSGVLYNVQAMARTDVQLMHGVKAGDEVSFELLLQKYRTPVIHFLGRMVRDRAQAEDLAQEVFIRVYRARDKYKPSAKFTTWLFRIATNLALNSVRDDRHHLRNVSIDETVDLGEGNEGTRIDVPSAEPGALERMLAQQRANQIRRAILALPEKQRAAVLLHKYQGMGYDEIARVLECSESALKSLLFRAYETLRVELAPLVSGL